jgi:type IV pilus assembly protein PilM
VGLDIGSRGIRAVQAARTDGGWTLERLASVDLPYGVVSNGTVKEPKEVTAALRRLWRRGRFSTKKVRLGITNSVIMARRADLPWMAAADFRKALRYQVADVLPVDLATVELDYHPLAELESVDEHGTVVDTVRVLLVAADTALVTSLSDVARKAHLEPVAADNDAFALLRAACAGSFRGTGAPEAIVDLGASQLTVVVHTGGMPTFVRTVANVGGDVVTTTLSDRLSISLEEAEELKRLTGLNGPAPVLAPIAESTVFGGVASSESALINPRIAVALDVINPWAANIIGEIRNSLEYFRAAEGGASVRGISVAGNTPLLEGVIDRMRTQLRLPVTWLPPTFGLPVSKRIAADPPVDARYAVAAGLAMVDRS